ncbi:hypothetical protein H5410_006246 [Solanum commersonii]|uniref:Uncharacterized protein n=1 Tax=Solanum commersonii TaxID=4109 RepID=A0A9J6A947_SOLCO|nr:hypothetical protein H5410_006227 [Solanum commersonii]KAG5621028.1 hypothetical protein H5410_006246 [Solanum commersonii]
MASTKSVKVPTIDFSNHQELKTKHSTMGIHKKSTICDKVPNDIREGMFGISKEIFEFPLETKLKNFSEKPMHGYMGMIPQLPLYESLCIPDLLNPQSHETFTNIFWPHGNQHFRNLIKSYSNHATCGIG